MVKVMTEEQLTLTLIECLQKFGWKILSYDFPQSGTGIRFYPDNRIDKSYISFIPDIIAIKEKNAIFMENKNRFVLSDFYKQNFIKKNKDKYSSIDAFFESHVIKNIYFGIGIPLEAYNKKREQYLDLVDFVICAEMKNIKIVYDKPNIII